MLSNYQKISKANNSFTIYTSVPACLANQDLGEHHYLRTESGLRFHYVAKGDPANPLMLFVHGFPEVKMLIVYINL